VQVRALPSWFRAESAISVDAHRCESSVRIASPIRSTSPGSKLLKTGFGYGCSLECSPNLTSTHQIEIRFTRQPRRPDGSGVRIVSSIDGPIEVRSPVSPCRHDRRIQSHSSARQHNTRYRRDASWCRPPLEHTEDIHLIVRSGPSRQRMSSANLGPGSWLARVVKLDPELRLRVVVLQPPGLSRRVRMNK
jgi:hypothetical protein